MKIYDKADYEIGKLELRKGAEPIAETDEQLDIDSVLIIDGRTYSACICSKIANYIVVDEIGEIEDMDTADEVDDDDEIVCPFCHTRFTDSFEKADENENYECDYCHSIFAYERRVSYCYHMLPVSKIERITVIKNV